MTEPKKPIGRGWLKRQKILGLKRRNIEIRAKAIAKSLGASCKVEGSKAPRARQMYLRVTLDQRTKFFLTVRYDRAEVILAGLRALLAAVRAGREPNR